MLTLVGISVRLRSQQRRGPEAELLVRRRLGGPLWIEHLGLCVALASGFALVMLGGGTARFGKWLGLKLGLVVFLVVPLEAMHAYVSHVWIARGLKQTHAPPFSKDLTRATSIDDMLRALGAPLLALALPLIVWLSLRRPF